jgi:hypothetical protein
MIRVLKFLSPALPAFVIARRLPRVVGSVVVVLVMIKMQEEGRRKVN